VIGGWAGDGLSMLKRAMGYLMDNRLAEAEPILLRIIGEESIHWQVRL
jgi:hypothetical protein